MGSETIQPSLKRNLKSNMPSIQDAFPFHAESMQHGTLLTTLDSFQTIPLEISNSNSNTTMSGDPSSLTDSMSVHVFPSIYERLSGEEELYSRRQKDRRSDRRSSTMCSQYGKFYGEVFETKERGRVSSLFRRRRLSGKDLEAFQSKASSKFTSDVVVRCGVLLKEGSWRRNWKSRFFILRCDFPCLCYYKSEEKLELLGEIALTSDTLIFDRCPSSGKAPYRFQIRSDKRSLLLEAPTRETQKRWIDACQDLVNMIRVEKYRHTNSYFIQPTSGCGKKPLTPRKVPLGLSMLNKMNMVQSDEDADVDNIDADAEEDGIKDINNQVVEDVEQLDCSINQSLKEIANNQEEVGDDENDEEEDDDEEDEEEDEDDDEEEEVLNQALDDRVRKDQAPLSSSTHQDTRSVMASHKASVVQPTIYDICLEVQLGAMSRLIRSEPNDNDRTRYFMKVRGFSSLSKRVEDIGTTDSVKMTSTFDSTMHLLFSLVLSCTLDEYSQLHLTLYKSSSNPNASPTCIAVGKCSVDDELIEISSRRPCVVPLAEKAVSFKEHALLISRKSLNNFRSSLNSPLSTISMTTTTTAGISGRDSVVRDALDSVISTDSQPENSNIQALLRIFRSKKPQEIFPSADVDMANTKYLVSTSSEHLVAVEEMLRVPNSTFAMPLAYLDFLEEQAVERLSTLNKISNSNTEVQSEKDKCIEFERQFYQIKLQEYVKHRQFLLKQERRLNNVQQEVEALKGGVHLRTYSDKDDKLEAPFKRSTLKSKEPWKYVPTNMQNQFLYVNLPHRQPQSEQEQEESNSSSLVIHTMTMGAPAAHSIGFTNGGYLKLSAAADNLSTSPAVMRRSFRQLYTSPSETCCFSCNENCSFNSLRLRLELKDRMDVIMSQILTAGISCVLASVDLALAGSIKHIQQLENGMRMGYLLNFESLLSTHGKESGMLEDFAAGVRWMRQVLVRFCKRSLMSSPFVIKKYQPDQQQSPEEEENKERSQGEEYVLVTIGLQDHKLAMLPCDMLAHGQTFRLRCVLFTQGINEKQTLVHALKSNAVKLQNRLNQENLEELKRTYSIYRALYCHSYDSVEKERIRTSRPHNISSTSGSASIPSSLTPEAFQTSSLYSLKDLDELLLHIEQHIFSSSHQYKKNVALLLDTSDFCREIGAARITCCKSGKDRTAMSVTLEQARISCVQLQATQGKSICTNMRLYGVRRKNVFLNTKKDTFAFNQVQRKMLPDCYKPPAGTYKSGKT
jgi:hypothetical protein